MMNNDIREVFQHQATNMENIEVVAQFSSEEVNKLRDIIGYHEHKSLNQEEFVALKNVLADYKRIKSFFWTFVILIALSVLTAVSQYSRAETISESKAKSSDVKIVSDELKGVKADIKLVKKLSDDMKTNKNEISEIRKALEKNMDYIFR